MTIELNHTIVPAHDKVVSAKFFARVFGLRYEVPESHFAPVRVNESLTLDFDNRGRFESHHARTVLPASGGSGRGVDIRRRTSKGTSAGDDAAHRRA